MPWIQRYKIENRLFNGKEYSSKKNGVPGLEKVGIKIEVV